MNFFDDIVASMAGTDDEGLQRLTPAQRQALDINATGIGLTATGEMVGAVSQFLFGRHAREAAQYQADQLRQNAGQAKAASQYAAEDVQRQTEIMQSRALAAAAASGAGASDPTVVNIIARNAGEGAYRKALALYQGEERARLMNMQADAREYEGKNTEIDATLAAGAQGVRAVSSIMHGYAKGASMFERFGSGAPGTPDWRGP